MPDLRAAVIAEMKRRGMSNYRLIQLLKGSRPDGKDVPASTIYSFVRDGSPINSLDLGAIMDVLELDVSSRKRGGK